MNNLYNKIYEAVDTGIQKALIISDDQSQDTSVIFHNKVINADVNMINYLVDELINTNDEYYYEQIVNYCNANGYKYKCDDINKLFKIFSKIRKFNDSNDSLELFKWMDTKNALSFVLDNNEEISLSDYTEDIKPLFLKISNDALRKGHNDILIYAQGSHYIPENKLQWQTDKNQIQNDKYLLWYNDVYKDKNYDGYTACQRIMNCKNNEIVPAIVYCIGLGINGHNGYLPSIGQLEIITDYIDLINFVFKNIQSETLNMDDNHIEKHWWSASEYTEQYAWIISNLFINYADKDNYNYVLPIFTL